MTSPEDIEAFKNHSLWGATEHLRQELRGTRPMSDIDRATISRAKNVTQYLLAFKGVAPELFPNQRLNQASSVENLVRGLVSQVQGWDQTGAMNNSTVSQIDSICDQILTEVSRLFWPALPNNSRSAIVVEAGRDFIETAESSLQALKADADLAHSEAQAAVSAAIAATEMVQNISDNAQAALKSFVAEQEATSEQWNATHQETMDDFQARSRKQRDDIFAAAKGQREKHAKQADEHLKSLAEDARRGQELVQRVGDQARAGGYDKFASRERRAYRLWISAGTVAVIATLVYLGVELREISQLDSAPDVSMMLLKTGLSVTAIAFSGFCFREAGKRQRNAIEANYRALDLLALDPFTEGMSDVEATAFRRMLGERIFASSPEPQGRRSDEKVTTFRLDVADIKSLADTAKVVKDLGT